MWMEHSKFPYYIYLVYQTQYNFNLDDYETIYFDECNYLARGKHFRYNELSHLFIYIIFVMHAERWM